MPTPPVSDLFGTSGRHWLGRQVLPADEQYTVQALLRQLDLHGGELKLVDTDLAKETIGDPVVARLMTIPGVDAIAISILAAVGDFSRFTGPHKLVAYVGLNARPCVSQATRHRCTGGSTRPAGPMSVECWWRRRRRPAAPWDRCERSTPGSKPAAVSRKRSSRPPGR